MIVKDEPIISVIVPVYNVEKYLRRCVDSILNQTMTNLEVILINDGSTDSSSKICDEYSKKDKRVRVIHKENSRVAAARNDGLKLAKGKYISFVDSDDWIEDKMYKSMYYTAEKFKTDFVMCDFIKKGVKHEYKLSQPISNGLYDKERINKYIFPCLVMFEDINFPPTISNCTCLFRRDFLIKNNLFYDEDIYYCEDSLFGSKILYNAKSFYYMKGSYFYNYFFNPNSTTTTYNEQKWNSYIKINERLEEYLKKSTFDFSRQIKINMLYFALNMMAENGKSNLSFREKRKKCKEIMRNDRVIGIFKDFKIPKVSKGLRIVIMLIKYRFSWIYSLLFYKR